MEEILQLLYLYAERHGCDKAAIEISFNLKCSGTVYESYPQSDDCAIFNFDSYEDLIYKLNK